MENENSLPLFTLGIDDVGQSYLQSIAKWNKFLAWVGIIVCSLGILGIVVGGSFMNNIYSSRMGVYGREMNGVLTATFIIYAIILGVVMIPSFYRLRFSNKMLIALQSNDQFTLNEAFANLKSFSKFWGILTIIFIAFYAIVLLIGVMGAVIR